jgi:hypothetical protein
MSTPPASDLPGAAVTLAMLAALGFGLWRVARIPLGRVVLLVLGLLGAAAYAAWRWASGGSPF